MFLELLLSSFYNVAVQLVLRVLFPRSVLSLDINLSESINYLHLNM